jgi:hypothetical protein
MRLRIASNSGARRCRNGTQVFLQSCSVRAQATEFLFRAGNSKDLSR